MKTPFLSLLTLSALLLGTFACEKQPKDDATSSGADTTGMMADTSTQAKRAKALADSLAAANRARSAYASRLRNLSETINRACPVSFTPAIYLDSSRALNGASILFNMRLRNYVAGSSDIELKKDETRKALMTSITADKQPIVAELRRNGVDILFRYRDKDGQPLFEIPLNAESR